MHRNPTYIVLTSFTDQGVRNANDTTNRSDVITGLLFGALDPLDPGIFQSVFVEILTLLIAFEFNHTLQYVVKRQQSIIQTQVVLLIALLAIARKFIVLDLGSVDAAQLLGLAAITLGLGIAYWLIRERDDRIDIASKTQAKLCGVLHLHYYSRDPSASRRKIAPTSLLPELRGTF